MKIKLSKSQWEMAGRKAGWIKVTSDYRDDVSPAMKDFRRFMGRFKDMDHIKFIRAFSMDYVNAFNQEQNESDQYRKDKGLTPEQRMEYYFPFSPEEMEELKKKADAKKTIAEVVWEGEKDRYTATQDAQNNEEEFGDRPGDDEYRGGRYMRDLQDSYSPKQLKDWGY